MASKTTFEAGNSIEELELEQLTWSTGDLSNSDRSSESSATIQDSSTEQTKIVTLKSLEFELSWDIKDEIIFSLSQHTRLLSGLVVKADVRKKIRKMNGDLVNELMNLPLKVDGRSSFESCSPNGSPNAVVLDLNWEARLRIVEILMANHNIALSEQDSVAYECKSKLIDQNNDLTNELLKLRSRTVAIPGAPLTPKKDRQVDQAAKASESKSDSSKCSMLQLQKSICEEVAVLKEELKKLKETGSNDGLGESIRTEICRNETTFTFEVKGIDALTTEGSTEIRKSELFNCGGFSWFLSVHSGPVDGVDHLAVTLHHNNLVDYWKIVTKFELRLMDSSAGPVFNDLVRIAGDREFAKHNLNTSSGYRNFISIDKLRACSFILNDTIKIRVRLFVKSFEKIFY